MSSLLAGNTNSLQRRIVAQNIDPYMWITVLKPKLILGKMVQWKCLDKNNLFYWMKKYTN